jgi:hypothetical protein
VMVEDAVEQPAVVRKAVEIFGKDRVKIIEWGGYLSGLWKHEQDDEAGAKNSAGYGQTAGELNEKVVEASAGEVL